MKKHALLIDYKYCTGCHSCEIACRQEKAIKSLDEWGIKFAEFGPEKLDGKWYWNYVPVPSSLCNLCEERIEAGKKPACVHHCLAQCMQVVPLEELSQKLDELGKGAACFMP